MPEVQLHAGTIEYQDVGSGPVVVLVHGLAMNGAQWRHVVADFRRRAGPGGGRFHGPAGGSPGAGLVLFLVRRVCCRRL
jgi:pimeloyl-ACP methyl ester carboxylesterase